MRGPAVRPAMNRVGGHEGTSRAERSAPGYGVGSMVSESRAQPLSGRPSCRFGLSPLPCVLSVSLGPTSNSSPKSKSKSKPPPTRFAGGSRLRHTIAPMVHPRQPQAPCQFRKKFKGLEASYSVGRHPTTVRQLSPETQATPQTAVRRGHVHFCVLRPF